MLFMLNVPNKPFLLSITILNVVMLNVLNKLFLLSVIMLNVVMLNVVAPTRIQTWRSQFQRCLLDVASGPILKTFFFFVTDALVSLWGPGKPT